MGEIHACRGEDGFQIMHYLVGLVDDVGGIHAAGGGVDGYLAGDIKRIAGQDGLAVWTDGGWGVGCIDHLLFHAARYGFAIFAYMKIAVIEEKGRMKNWFSG